ncbi:DUF4214 domain-containing protein [Roseomonas sp. BN140053]|uniref:DUF4214 domain-containing protein n=1 Tax=Roseomonas sp. BN140053 TaxID=3391898 RepID=UPI0039E74BC3
MAVFNGLPSGDSFNGRGGFNDQYNGNGGFDTLSYAGLAGTISLTYASYDSPGAGNTVVKSGGLGTDTIASIERVIGSAGSDTLAVTFASSSASVYLDGGGGADTIRGNSLSNVYADYFSSSTGVAADLAAGTATVGGVTDTLNNIRAVRGGSGNDTLLGDNNNNRFQPVTGTDTVDGRGGFDTLVTGNNAAITVVLSAVGQGTVTTAGLNATTNFVNLEEVVGNLANDSFTGSAGDDWFAPGGGSNLANGGAGFDFLDYSWFFTNGVQVRSGVVGSLATGSVSNLYGGTDSFTGFEGLQGSDGADDLAGADLGPNQRAMLRGGEGNDVLRGAPTGWTAADYSASALSAAVTVNLAAGTAADGQGGTDTLVGINAARGSRFNDSLTGNDVANWLTGGAGNDTLRGAGGNDRLAGDEGNDLLDGGAGTDWVDVQSAGRRGSSFALQGNGDVTQTRGAQVDTFRGVETAVFADGRMVFDAADPAAQVVRLYNAALARGPEQAGLNFYIDALQHGRPLAEIAAGFNGSPEFQARYGANLSLDAYLGQLYQNVLGRGASEAELQYYRDRAAAGDSRETFLANFSESPENQARTAGLVQNGIWDVSESAAQVARLYDTMFGRLPDLAGLRFYKDQLDAGTATLQGVVQSFTGSPEFQALYGTNPGSTEFVQLLYRNSLDRGASQDEINYYVPKLDSGVLSRADVVVGFSESPEHQTITAPDITSETTFGIAFV